MNGSFIKRDVNIKLAKKKIQKSCFTNLDDKYKTKLFQIVKKCYLIKR